MMPYTEAQIRENMRTSRDWLERGILAINNNEGFSEIDADYLIYLARWIQSGKPLSTWTEVIAYFVGESSPETSQCAPKRIGVQCTPYGNLWTST